MTLTMRELKRATGVSRATIYHYIDLGLLPAPERPNRQMAYYHPGCIDRVRLIRRLQKQRFLPLSVIREVLETDGSATLMEADALLLESLQTPGTARDDVLERYPIAANVVSQLADAGLISDGDTWTPDEVKIIAAVQTMREAGLDEEHGFEVTGLALYVSATESLIDAEIGLFNTRTLREGSGTDYARLAAAAIDGSSRLLGALHRRLLSQRLKGDS